MGVMNADVAQPIRLLIDIQGDFRGLTSPPKGVVVEVESHHATCYFDAGIAQPVQTKGLIERVANAFRDEVI